MTGARFIPAPGVHATKILLPRAGEYAAPVPVRQQRSDRPLPALDQRDRLRSSAELELEFCVPKRAGTPVTLNETGEMDTTANESPSAPSC